MEGGDSGSSGSGSNDRGLAQHVALVGHGGWRHVHHRPTPVLDRSGLPFDGGSIMNAYVAAPARDVVDRVVPLSRDDLDELRGLLLAEIAAASARIAEYEALLFKAPTDAFGAELRLFARGSIAFTREAVADLERTLERLVESHRSCEWCDTVISPRQRKVIPPRRLCAECRQR